MRLDKFSFQEQVEKKSLFAKSDKLLVAVSGGLDSMALVHLLESTGYSFQIAHVNFGLRDDESNGDEIFVRDYAEKRKIPFHLKRASDKDFNNDKTGVQQTARELRYRWFDELASELKADYILLAHHRDDQSETILHQFLRGGMLAALRGMHDKSNRYVRPLLTFSREEIAQYAKANNLQWREDSSNQSTKYTRNFIRHEVMPMLQKINSDIQSSLASRAIVFEEMERLVQSTIQNDIEKNVLYENERTTVPCDWLAAYPYKHTLIWQLISAYNFTSAQTDDVLSLTDSQSGARVESALHSVIKDREHLIIVKRENTTLETYTVSQLPFSNKHFHLDEVSPDEVIFGNEHTQFLDLDSIEFPLQIRRWQEGDKIQPLGMKGTQKVSDILIQQKISILDKENICVITDHTKQLIAVAGLRISERCKINTGTKRVLRIVMQ